MIVVAGVGVGVVRLMSRRRCMLQYASCSIACVVVIRRRINMNGVSRLRRDLRFHSPVRVVSMIAVLVWACVQSGSRANIVVVVVHHHHHRIAAVRTAVTVVVYYCTRTVAVVQI